MTKLSDYPILADLVHPSICERKSGVIEGNWRWRRNKNMILFHKVVDEQPAYFFAGQQCIVSEPFDRWRKSLRKLLDNFAGQPCIISVPYGRWRKSLRKLRTNHYDIKNPSLCHTPSSNKKHKKLEWTLNLWWQTQPLIHCTSEIICNDMAISLVLYLSTVMRCMWDSRTQYMAPAHTQSIAILMYNLHQQH